MGYCDENNNTTRSNKTEYQRKYVGKTGNFFTCLLGVFICIASINFAEPYISSITGNAAAISLPSTSTSTSKIGTTAVPFVNNTNATNLPGMITDTKKVVIGVINIQKNLNVFILEQNEQEAGLEVIYK